MRIGRVEYKGILLCLRILEFVGNNNIAMALRCRTERKGSTSWIYDGKNTGGKIQA